MDILLLDSLLPEAHAWLEERHRVATRLDLADDPSAMRKAIYKASAVVLPRKVAVTRELLDFAPLLKAVARMHAGSDNTDLEACRERRVRVIQARTATVRSNAEFLLASLLLLYRRGIGAALIGERGAEARMGRELHGSVVGIFGLAPTAHTLAMMLNALGARLVGYDPAVHSTAGMWARLKIQPVSLQEMLERSDAVSAQVLYASRYRNFVNDKVLAHCKPGQLWVGISRSELFEPQALARALGDGRIEAAMLDGAEAGFAARGSPLHEASNLFLTPRVGSYTVEARIRASWYVAHRVHEVLTAPVNSGLDSFISGPMELEGSPGAAGPGSGPGAGGGR